MTSQSTEHSVILSFGSNVGDRRRNITLAIEFLKEKGIIVTRLSSFYRTSPVGYEDQDDFLNAAGVAGTKLGPHELLEEIKCAEKDLGRESGGPRWGPRIIDIDIILFGREKISDPDLIIPHPRMGERLFVLAPVLEIVPEFIMPDGETFADFHERITAAGNFSLQEIEKLP